MVDSAAKGKHKSMKKKRKAYELKDGEHIDSERPTKAPRRHGLEEEDDDERKLRKQDALTGKTMEALAEDIDAEGPDLEFEEHRQWRNLELLLSIENKELDAQKKVNMVLDYVKLSALNDGCNEDGVSQILSSSRVIMYVSNWIQSLLISSEKKARAAEGDQRAELLAFCLDYRCWEIFRFCLKGALTLHISLSLSRDLLRVISCVARHALYLCESVSLCKTAFFGDKDSELYSLICDCAKFVFSSHGGVSNGNLDLWVGAADSVLQLVIHTYEGSGTCGAGDSYIKLSCFVLESFSKFLRIHPCRKSGFRDFVSKLLEPLFHLFGLLHDRNNSCSLMWTDELNRLIKQVLSYGLFHPIHIDEFYCLRCTEGYSSSVDGKLRDSKTMIKSYHRHLFDKIENIVFQRKVVMFTGVGELFCLFVDSLRKQRTDSLNGGSSRLGKNQSDPVAKGLSTGGGVKSRKNDDLLVVNFQKRKSIFDFFILNVEQLLLVGQTELRSKSQVEASLLYALLAVRSINKMLTSMIGENLYQRTKDTIGEGMLNFFKVIYSMVVSYFVKIKDLWLLPCGQNGVASMDMLILTAKELVLALKCFLEIEYQVFGDDLADIWKMLIVFLTLSYSVEDTIQVCPLTSVTIDIACELVKLYSDLRQVSGAVMALCAAVRHISFSHSNEELKDYNCVSSSSYSFGIVVKSANFLLCSQKFRMSISSAIKTIPEGQAGECLEALTKDISASLGWTNVSSAEVGDKTDKVRCHGSSFRAEHLGVLIEIYAQILGSISVTTGNGKAVAASVEKLIMVLRPHLTTLLDLKQGDYEKFAFLAAESTLNGSRREMRTNVKNAYPWMCLFFFHLYLSCRSLYRQADSLKPADSSKDMSAASGDPVTVYCGYDWMKKIDLADEGYFSWIIRSSASLCSVVQSTMLNLIQQDSTLCCPLVYVMHAMAFQRLVDLNKKIESIHYLVLEHDNLLQSKLTDVSSSLLLPKKRKKWEKLLAALRQEAASLTDFVLEYILMLKGKQLSIFTVGEKIANDSSTETHEESDPWDLAVCSVNEKTLPVALWWIVCQNLDLWCIHAAKSKLKLFLSLLIHSAVSLGMEGVRKDAKDYTGDVTGVTVHQISWELLHDTVFYEQKFVCRYLASRFCRVSETLLLLSSDSTDACLKLTALPDWREVFSALEISSTAAYNKGQVEDCYHRQTSFAVKSLPIASFLKLLNLLCQVPKRSLSRKSFIVYATFLLNCERVLVGSLMEPCSTLSSQKQSCLCKGLVSCRRTLKHLLIEFCEDRIEANEYSILPIFSESSYPVLWLLKSVNLVVEQLNDLSIDGEANAMVFSLMDNTSYACSTLCKYQFAFGVNLLLDKKKHSKEHPDDGHNSDKMGTSDTTCFPNSTGANARKSAACIAETLEGQILGSFSDVSPGLESMVSLGIGDLNKILPLMTCIRGFLWGLASAMDYVDIKGRNLKLVKYKQLYIDSISRCIHKFMNLMDSITKMFFIDNTREPGMSNDVLPQLQLDNNATSPEVGESLRDISDDMAVTDCENQLLNTETGNRSLLSSDVDDSGSSAHIKIPPSDGAHLSVDLDLLTYYPLRENLLRSLLGGDNQNLGFLLKELYIASSAVLRLNTVMKCFHLSTSLIEILFGSSQFLLIELSNIKEVPKPYSFAWLDGSLKFLEELGTHLSLFSPTMTMNVYSKLINLYLKAIGKCITLQGKIATSDSDIGSGNNTLGIQSQIASSESDVSCQLCWMQELKSRLRMSVKVLLKQSSELHLLSAVQIIGRALVGVHEGWTMLYNVYPEAADERCASAMIAAGVDCLDLVLERVTGHKCLSEVRRQIQSLVAPIFNIILHLQGPAIFYRKLNLNEPGDKADSGVVVFMCIRVLNTVSRKHALFQMDPGHVGQYLRIPSALFQNFQHLRLCKASHPTDNQPAASSFLLDRQFSLTLYAACCQLLCTVVKHHNSGCIQCIPLLQKSLQALLNSLELVGANSSYKEVYFTWEVQEGIRCASHLRRVYEEIKQQRDVFGQHCFLFLSDYVWIYSGYGPQKRGIEREIDDALRPGIYALVDVCSTKDLQYLHAVFGEGPCRSTLATLRQDYKMNFQYEGKV